MIFTLKCSILYPAAYAATIQPAGPSAREYQTKNLERKPPPSPQKNQPSRQPKKDPKPQTTKPKEVLTTKPTGKPTINTTKTNSRTTLLTSNTKGNPEHTSQKETLHSTTSEGYPSPSQVYTTSDYLSQSLSSSNTTK